MSIRRNSSRGLGCLMLLALALLVMTGCNAPASPTPEAPMPGRLDPSFTTLGPTPTPAQGLQFSLAPGADQPASVERVPVAPAQPLSPADTQRILNRLPALEGQAGDTQDFAFPPQSLPAPRPGATIKEPFPPIASPTAAPEVVAGPLAVLRYAPEGDVALASNLSLTFNQPMVALADVTTVNQQVPVTLTPLPEGQWRWVGTKTLVFEPAAKTGFAAGRFPGATKYTVEVPTGVTSATGGKLANAVKFTFTTPPVQVQEAYPKDVATRLDPLLFISFDQRIDPAAVLKTITVTAGDRQVSVRPATEAEVAADPTVSSLASRALEGRWLALTPTEPLPADTAVTVAVGPNTPSAEGPLTTTAAYQFTFRTFGPLRVKGAECGWGGACAPLMPWQIHFSNPLDRNAFSETMIVVEPELPGRVINVYGDTVEIQGRSKGQTTYTVRLAATLKDIYGQTLGRNERVTLRVGPAQPALQVPGDDFIVLDPSAPPGLSTFSINIPRLAVRAYAVTPEDWPAYKAYLREAYRTDQPPTPPGRLVLNKTVNIEAAADELVESRIDLVEAFRDKPGHAIVIITPEQTGLSALLPGRHNRPRTEIAWVERTSIGLDAFVDANSMVAWANSLATGAALGRVELTLFPGAGAARTAADGTATLPLPAGKDATLLVARQGDDTAILPANAYYWGEGGWRQQGLVDRLAWYVFDDRQMYRPSEEVHIKGWLRRVGAGPRGDIAPLDPAIKAVNYQLRDARGNQVAEGSAPIVGLGGFDFVVKLTDTMNLGYAYLELSVSNAAGLDGAAYSHGFQVQEFRRPEFEVKTTASEGPHFVGGGADLQVSANYYAGGPLPNADVTWQVTTQTGSYSPPGWDDFTFGRWAPWWRAWGRFDGPAIEASQTYTGTTDAAGLQRVRIGFDAVTPPEPTTVTAEATVMDVNRQAWTSSTMLLVHPASLYVGLRTERLFVERDEPLPVDIIVTDLDGQAQVGVAVQVKAARLAWQYTDGAWAENEVAVEPCAVTSAAEPVRCTFQTPEGGSYRITAEITDAAGRPNRTELTRWVSGGKRPLARAVEQEEATLIPNQKTYQPGDTAEILVQSPFFPAEGLLTLRREGLVQSQRFTMDESTITLRVPIGDAYTPNVQVQVDLVGAAVRTGDAAAPAATPAAALPERPAYAMGTLNLSVPPLARTLAVEVAPTVDKLEPGGTTEVDVIVRDATGRPVEGAELAVAIVDEAILALTGYDLPDPLTTFYGERSANVSDYHNRGYIVLANPEALETAEMARDLEKIAEAPAMSAAPMPAATAQAGVTNDGARGAPDAPIAVRADFNPLAYWVPAVPTDAEGRARITVKLPDNLTRYRVMVVAVAGGKQFGKGQSALTARLPLMVRPAAPRFLNFGDEFELPVVVQNQTDAPMTVDVAVRGANVRFTDGAGRRVTVPANDRVEVRFPTTTVSAGVARVQIAAAAGKWADAATIALPVWTPATTEAFAVYGTLDNGAVAQPVIAPTGVYTQFGGLEISTSSTALQALTDAYLYLVEYPFECSEQIASRILAVAALRDVMSAFKAAGLPQPSEIEAAMGRDIALLGVLQNSDGGWPVWTRGDPSWPYHSIHTAHALQRAKMKGYAVPAALLDQALSYLRGIEKHYPAWYSESVRRTLTAYALYTRNLMGDKDAAQARALVDGAGLDKLSPEAIGWLLAVLTDDPGSTAQVTAIRRHLLNRVTETAGAAHFVADYGDQGYVLLASNRRADGILLDALIGDQPESDLIPKIVRGLLANRTAGRWANTQENAFILLALDRYFNTYEAQTPDFVARAWLGDRFAGESTFRGRETAYRALDIPMAQLATSLQGAENLVLSKEGTGRLYYRLGLKYAPTDLTLPAYDAGFTVARTYEAVDDAGDVSKNADGDWVIQAGARVRVRITMVAPARRYHVALTDPLPAGLEPLNPALAVSGALPVDPQTDRPRRWWWGPWYSHQNLRDQRAEAFTTLLWEGVYNYSYLARATTPGRFVVPPAKAEEMYAPETFGRSAGDIVIVR